MKTESRKLGPNISEIYQFFRADLQNFFLREHQKSRKIANRQFARIIGYFTPEYFEDGGREFCIFFCVFKMCAEKFPKTSRKILRDLRAHFFSAHREKTGNFCFCSSRESSDETHLKWRRRTRSEIFCFLRARNKKYFANHAEYFCKFARCARKNF